MKIAVIGASGKSGLKFIDLALLKGYQVKAGVNRTNKLTLEKENLEVIKCNALNYAEVENLISGCQAVISLIGHGRKSPSNLQTEAISNVIKVMENNNIRRLISLTGTGVRKEADKITLLDRLLNFSIGLIDPKRISDGIKHSQVIASSNLDWTVLRVLKLHDLYESKFTLTEFGPAKTLVSREEVARAIILLIEDNSFVKKFPIISKIK